MDKKIKGIHISIFLLLFLIIYAFVVSFIMDFKIVQYIETLQPTPTQWCIEQEVAKCE